MSDKEYSLTEELLEKITDTDTWRAELMKNPGVQEAEEKMSEALEALGGDKDDRAYAMNTAAYLYADAVTKAAVLY